MINYTDDIKVSVCVVTYNQEKYIAECLDSLINQEANFKFEIIVGEDCSTDNTREIVQQYVEKYPDLIVPLFYEENVGAVENIKQVYKKARGRYIAHMDGDDMALPNKLQKQFDIMEKNPQAMICSHSVSALMKNGIIKDSYFTHSNGEYTFLDLVKELPFFAHSSKFFRNIDIIGLSNVLSNKDVLDIEIHLYQASKGTIIHINENLGCYRVSVGISTPKDGKLNEKIVERVVYVYKKLMISNPEIRKDVERAYSKYLLNTAYSYGLFNADGCKMRYFAIESIKNNLHSSKQIIMLLLAINSYIGIPLLKFKSKVKNR